MLTVSAIPCVSRPLGYPSGLACNNYGNWPLVGKDPHEASSTLGLNVIELSSLIASPTVSPAYREGPP